MNLIIVESPTKSRTLSRFLGKNYQILATMGHIRDLPKKKLGVDVEKGFRPQYVQVPGKKEAIKKLKQAFQGAEKIYLATDPDREGEAIAYHAAVLLGPSGDTFFAPERSGLKTPEVSGGRRKSARKGRSSLQNDQRFLRITFHEITKSAIEKALSQPGMINMQLVHAQQARRILDRLVGYKLSPLLWRKIRKGLSAGRVQSVAVRLIVDREREIEKFVPEEYWDVGCQLRKKIGRKRADLPTFLAKLTKKNGQAIKVGNRLEAEEIVGELKKAGFEVEKVAQKEVKKSPPPPFITSTLQRTAFAKLGFSSKQTMRLAQSLYEGGLITYHRTDSVALSKEALVKIRQYIKRTYPADHLPEKPRFYKTRSKVAQEAHEAIRPTNFSRERAGITFQNEREGRLYDLIFRRAIASQMKAALFDQTKVFVRAEGMRNVYSLLSEGRVIKFPGWLTVYDAGQYGKRGAQNENKKEERLPPLERGDELALVKVLSEQKFTSPPPRYNEASLIKALEEKGIGRPSTYVPIIATIQERQYVEKIEKKFKPTQLGMTVNDFLVEYFPGIIDYDFTAKMEDGLDGIARGEKEWVALVDGFYKPFAQKLAGVLQVAERVKVPVEVVGEKCPKCQKGELVIRVGRFGKFIACSRFPDCGYRANYVEKLEGVKCPKCGGEVVIRKTKKGKQFYGCSNWPKCNWATWRKPR